jgi:hypothetical protein
MNPGTAKGSRKTPAGIATGQCLCGKIQVEIAIPAFWAWHDHSRATRRAHGATYATYVGCWRSRVRVAKGKIQLAHFKDPVTGDERTFCSRCGTPVAYARARSPRMVRSRHCAELCDRSRLLSHRNRSACKWRFESLAFRLGVRGSIWNRINRKPMDTPRWALSASCLSSRVRAEPSLQVLALLWFAVPWFRSFISGLRLSFLSLDDRGGFVRGMADETILEPVQGSEW